MGNDYLFLVIFYGVYFRIAILTCDCCDFANHFVIFKRLFLRSDMNKTVRIIFLFALLTWLKNSLASASDIMITCSQPINLAKRNLVCELPQQNYIVDGNDFELVFPVYKDKVVFVADGSCLTFKNCLLANFNYAAIDLGMDAKLCFADGCQISLGNDLVNDSPQSYMFMGQVRIIGNGHNLILQATKAFTILAEGELTINDATLQIKDPFAIAALADSEYNSANIWSGCLRLADVYLQIADCGFIWEHGRIIFEDLVHVSKLGNISYDVRHPFFYSSPNPLFIETGSILKIALGIELNFSKAATTEITMTLADASATLFLQACQLVLTGKELRCDAGQVFIDQKTEIFAEPLMPGKLLIGKNCRASIYNQANLILKNVSLVI